MVSGANRNVHAYERTDSTRTRTRSCVACRRLAGPQLLRPASYARRCVRRRIRSHRRPPREPLPRMHSALLYYNCLYYHFQYGEYIYILCIFLFRLSVTRYTRNVCTRRCTVQCTVRVYGTRCARTSFGRAVHDFMLSEYVWLLVRVWSLFSLEFAEDLGNVRD